MTESGFILGLGLGLLICVCSLYWSRLQWMRVLRQYNIEPLRSPLPIRLRTLLSHQHQEQARLLAEIEHWQQILHQAPLAYIEVNDDRLCCWSNPAAQSLFGVTPQPGRLLIEMVRSYELDCLVDEIQSSQQPGVCEWLQTVFLPSGQSQRLPLRGYGVPLGGGRVGLFLENRQEVRTLRDERDRWASDVAHELKTPLTSLRLVAETLQERVDPGLRPWVNRLLGETVRLSLLVQELLELNRLSFAPASEIERHPLDLVKLAWRAWENLEPLATPRNVHLAYAGPESLVYVGNEAQLFRLILNLLDNALKYTASGSVIELGITLHQAQGESGVKICIHDQGPGFSEQDLPYIFERFFRSDPSRSRQPVVTVPTHSPVSSPSTPISSGSGLGLAIVQQIVDCHQGRIEARNDEATGGAVVIVWLPPRITPMH